MCNGSVCDVLRDDKRSRVVRLAVPAAPSPGVHYRPRNEDRGPGAPGRGSSGHLNVLRTRIAALLGIPVFHPVGAR